MPSDEKNQLMQYVSSATRALISHTSFSPQNNSNETESIQVEIRKMKGRIEPIWAWIGYDESNYTYMKEGRKLLTELTGTSSTPVYVRTHNLLTSGDSTPALKWGSTNTYTEDENGKPVYDWTIID